VDTTSQEVTLEELERNPRYAAWLFERCRPYLGPRVLDFGAGIGTFTALVADCAEEVVALEPEPRFSERLEARFAHDSRVEVARVEARELEPGSLGAPFDSLLCLNVLEHIDADVDALSRLRAQLRPGGRLLLLVPAHPLLYGTVDAALGHFRRYSKRELRRKLEGARFAVRELRFVNAVGVPAWFAYGRVLRHAHLAGPGMRAVDPVVPVARRVDALHLPFGLSLWAVAERPAASSNR
jgi:SAM-dependent methyltransferase